MAQISCQNGAESGGNAASKFCAEQDWTALNYFFNPNQLHAKINDVEGPGEFVSNFLAYHVMWYREWWAAQHPPANQACLFSGHTHVGGQISVADAEQAVEIQLEELYRDLPFT